MSSRCVLTPIELRPLYYPQTKDVADIEKLYKRLEYREQFRRTNLGNTETGTKHKCSKGFEESQDEGDAKIPLKQSNRSGMKHTWKPNLGVRISVQAHLYG